jgi:hypothetical protein
MLLAAGTDPDVGEWGFRRTALKAAVCGQHTAVVKALLKASADPGSCALNVHDSDWQHSSAHRRAQQRRGLLLAAAGCRRLPKCWHQKWRSLLAEGMLESPLMLMQYTV